MNTKIDYERSMLMSLLEQRTKHGSNYRVHVVNTKKFKTISIIIHLKQSLASEHITKRALLPYVLQSATERLPSVKEIRQYLEQLYDMTLAVDVAKKGDNHIITFRVDLGHEDFLFRNENLVEKGFELLADVILRPKGFNEKSFDKDIVRKEKRSLKQKIEAIYDDKMRYANMRLIQEMFENEPFSQIVYGKMEEIDNIDERNLFSYYENVILRDMLDIYVVGDVNPDEVQSLIERHFVFPSERQEKSEVPCRQKKEIFSVKEKIEQQDIHQGKLNIGFRTNTTYQDIDYPALQVFNGIFGGFSHSKLFIHVREKESLAYYASSRLESHKGLLIVMSGIDSANYKRTVEIINEQMEKMKQGAFTDDEFVQTKIMLKNQILEVLDDPRGIVNLLYNNMIANVTFSIDDIIQKIESVTREEIVDVANKIELDTIYFLKGKEENKQ